MGVPVSGLQPIDKRLVHKQKKENVLLANLRRELPPFLTAKTAEDLLFPFLTEAERQLFLQYYLLHLPERPELPAAKFPYSLLKQEPCYVLFNLPHSLESELVRSGLLMFTPPERNFILQCFESTDDGYVLHANLTEEEALRLFQLLDPQDIHIPESQAVDLSRIFEKVTELPKTHRFLAGMVIEPSHDYFFEHPNEHVPGMMILEAARQMTVACCHSFGNLPLKGFQFILGELQAQFHDYVDLHYPVSVEALLEKVEMTASKRWTYADFSIRILQNRGVCGQLRMGGRIIETKLFHRIRKSREKINPKHRFYPVAEFYHRISYFPEPGHQGVDGELVDLSTGGFRMRLTAQAAAQVISRPEGEFLLCFQDLGFIRGFSRLCWTFPEGSDHVQLGFSFQDVTAAMADKLTQAIKTYCFIREERGAG